MDRPTTEPDVSERRRSQRKALRTGAVVGLPGGQRFEVRTLDISTGGLAIVAGANPRPGTRFELEFALPMGSRGVMPVRVTAQVAHSVFSSAENGFKVGLFFVDPQPQLAQAVAAYMR